MVYFIALMVYIAGCTFALTYHIQANFKELAEKPCPQMHDVPPRHPFIDLLVENTENAARDEGIYFLSSIKNGDDEGVCRFKELIEKYKKQPIP